MCLRHDRRSRWSVFGRRGQSVRALALFTRCRRQGYMPTKQLVSINQRASQGRPICILCSHCSSICFFPKLSPLICLLCIHVARCDQFHLAIHAAIHEVHATLAARPGFAAEVGRARHVRFRVSRTPICPQAASSGLVYAVSTPPLRALKEL